MLEELKDIKAPDGAALTKSAQAAHAMVQSMAIETDGDAALVGEELQAIKAKQKALEEKRTSITGPMNAALKAVNALFKGPAEILEKAEAKAKSLLLDWDEKKARLAREEQARAEELAREEREKLEAQAAELQAKAVAAEESGTDDGIAVAQQLQQQAAEVISVAEVISAPALRMPAVRVSGTSTRTTTDFEVTDKLKLIQHVAANPHLVDLLDVDSTRLRNLVKAMGMNTQLPGVRVFEKKTLAARAA